MLMSSAGFTGKTHLLSSERSDNITNFVRNVKKYFYKRGGAPPLFYKSLIFMHLPLPKYFSISSL